MTNNTGISTLTTSCVNMISTSVPATTDSDIQSKSHHINDMMSTPLPTTPRSKPDAGHGNSTEARSIAFPTAEPKSFSWERCPVEVRDMIFDVVTQDNRYYFDWEGCVPPLVIALRPLEVSYQHVLQRFVEQNRSSFAMYKWTGFSIRDMNQVELDTIQTVSLELR